MLLVNPTVLPAKTAKELADTSKANPGKYSFASAGTGTTPHLSGELFKLTYKLDIVHVPFGGAGPAIQSILAAAIRRSPSRRCRRPCRYQGGKLRALAVANKTRVACLPDVPTLAEAGIPDQEADTFQAVLVPAGTPKEIVALHLQRGREGDEVAGRDRKMEQLGLEIICNTPEQFTRRSRSRSRKWGKVIKDANIKVQ